MFVTDPVGAKGLDGPRNPIEGKAQFSSPQLCENKEGETIGRAPERTLGKILIDNILSRDGAETAVPTPLRLQSTYSSRLLESLFAAARRLLPVFWSRVSNPSR